MPIKPKSVNIHVHDLFNRPNNVNTHSPCFCEQGKGRGEKGEKKREGKGKPVRIHQYFDCRSFIIYAGPSFNYSNARSINNNNNNNKNR